jgi:hypothetical protein
MYLYLYCVKWRNQLQEGAADSKGEKTSQVLLFRILSSTRTLAVYLNLVRRCLYWAAYYLINSSFSSYSAGRPSGAAGRLWLWPRGQGEREEANLPQGKKNLSIYISFVAKNLLQHNQKILVHCF